jgi:hypothetical protein
MSFRISNSFERLFKKQNATPAQSQSSTEETVFIIDEETGEIREEKQMVESSQLGVVSLPQTNLPPKSGKNVGLCMSKTNKESFM